MPQSEVSRIESGRILPTAVDVERILTALKVPSEVAAALLSLARAANVDYALAFVCPCWYLAKAARAKGSGRIVVFDFARARTREHLAKFRMTV
jgi:hypothetical protein